MVSPGLTIPADELSWRFSRSAGPGGQSVNTTDSRVELSWAPLESRALGEGQRRRLVPLLVNGRVRVSAAQERSQWQNRRIARHRLAALVRTALAPPARPRIATRPSRASQRRRMQAKRRRGELKQQRRIGPADQEG